MNLFPDSLAPTHRELDITDRNRVFDFIENFVPDRIIHTAAVASITRCELNKELGWRTNVLGTENLVDACLKFDPSVHFVYLSTACVFDGKRGMYTEEDIPYPENFYSLTKLLGEFVVKKLNKHLIIRTNFVARDKWPYPRAFTDRFGTYLFADEVAKGIKEVVEANLTGIIHIVGDRKMSMYEIAKITTPEVKPMTLRDYHGEARLTVDMTLDTIRWKRYKLKRRKT